MADIDWEDPQRQALLALAAGLLTPVRNKGASGFGEALSHGIGAGLMGYNQASQNKRRNELSDMEVQKSKLTISDLQRKLNEADQFRKIVGGYQAPSPYEDAKQGMPSLAPTVDNQSALQQRAGPAPTGKQSEYQRLYGIAKALEAARLPEYAQQYYDKAEKVRPEVKDTKTLTDPTGKRVTVNIYKDGTSEVVPFGPDAEKLHFADNGQSAGIGLDPFTGQIRSQGLKKQLSPSEAANLAQSERHFQMNYGKPQLVEGQDGYSFVSPPQAGGQPQVIPVPQLGKGTKNQPSEAELTAAGYASRMDSANRLLDTLPPAALPGVAQTVANNRYPTVAPYVSNTEQQKYRQAQEDWVRAKLRKESGAVIADEEMAREIRVYFPQPGDKPEVIKQKAAARQRANESMMLAAGKARNLIKSGPSLDELVKQYSGGG